MTQMEFMQIIGNNIKSELEDSWMTQKELAEATGVSESTISRYIKAEMMPSLVNITNIAVALCCTVDDIISFDGDTID